MTNTNSTNDNSLDIMFFSLCKLYFTHRLNSTRLAVQYKVVEDIVYLNNNVFSNKKPY